MLPKVKLGDHIKSGQVLFEILTERNIKPESTPRANKQVSTRRLEQEA